METLLIQSRAAQFYNRSKNLYFLAHIFHYLFRSKHELKDNCRFRHFGDLPQKYFSKKPTLPSISVIVGFFLCQDSNNHFIYTFNF